MPLTPFLDDDGLFSVVARLNKAAQTYSANHPLLSHSRSRNTRPLIEMTLHDWPSGSGACQASPATDFPHCIETNAAKSSENFHLQTILQTFTTFQTFKGLSNHHWRRISEESGRG